MADVAAKASSGPQAAAPARAAPRGVGPAVGAAPVGPAAAVLDLHATAGNRAVSELLGTGRPLETGLRVDMEARFGASFEQVRLHDDRAAHRSAALLEAKAYTHGEHIVFGEDRFAPHGRAGRRLLAHELAHVVQQRRGGAAPALDADAAHEHAAHRAADAVVAGGGSVDVDGATAVGIARDEDDSFIGRMKRKAQALKDSIPPEYAEKAQKAADYVADKTVDMALLPMGGAAVADGLGSKLLHAAQGKADAGEELKGFARDKALEGVGAVKGVVTQVTEVADTAMWFGNEYGELRDKAATAIGGKPGTAAHAMVKSAIDIGATIVPGGAGLVQASQASDAARKAGWVDKTGHASVTEPMAAKMNQAGDWIEDKVGGKPSDPSFFTPMEKGELEGAIGSQVLLAFTGAEEVKVGLAIVGLASSIRGIVESIRADRNGFYKNPAFWGAILSAALTVAGLARLRAATRITNIALKSGALLSAVPPLWQLYNDYNDAKLAAGDPDERHKVLAHDWNAVIRVVADALIAVAHAGMQGKSPPKGKTPSALGEPEGGGTAPKAGVTGNVEADNPVAKPQPGASGEAQDPATRVEASPTAAPDKRAVDAAAPARPAGDAKPAVDAKAAATAKARKVLDEAQAQRANEGPALDDVEADAPKAAANDATNDAASKAPAVTPGEEPVDVAKPQSGATPAELEADAAKPQANAGKAPADEPPGAPTQAGPADQEPVANTAPPEADAAPAKPAKAAKGPKTPKAPKAAKAPKTPKPPKAAKAPKPPKAPKAPKAKGPRPSRPKKTDVANMTLDERIAETQKALKSSREKTIDYFEEREEAGLSRKGGPKKGIDNAKEALWMLKRQKAYPDRQLLQNCEVRGVRGPDGKLRTTKAIGGTGREPDFVELDGGKATMGELKSEWELDRSLKGGPGTKQGGKTTVDGGSKVGGQFDAEDKVIAHARKVQGKVVVSGYDLRTGQRVEVEIDPNQMGRALYSSTAGWGIGSEYAN